MDEVPKGKRGERHVVTLGELERQACGQETLKALWVVGVGCSKLGFRNY